MNIFNGKKALQSVYLDDILIPISNEQREQLQHVLYDVYGDILDVSNDVGLTPFLVGGSALGAIRHKGFIPWDDDLDIGFIRSEYELFLNAFEDKYGDKYYLNSPGKQTRTRARFTKILKKGTVFREMISLPDVEDNGIFVDVFPIDNVPNNTLKRTIKGFNADIIAYISSQVFTRENRTVDLIMAMKRTGKSNYYFRMAIGCIFGIKKSSWWFERYDNIIQYSDCKSNICTIAAGRKHYFGEMIKREMIFPPQYAIFGPYKAPVFHDVDGYLSQMYGKYMEIPSETKRERHYIKELIFE